MSAASPQGNASPSNPPPAQPGLEHRASSGVVRLALILGVVALVLGGAGLGIALTHAGATGAKGADATNLWAIVNATGVLLAGKGASSSLTESLGLGLYQVGFDQNVSACIYTGTGYIGTYIPLTLVVGPRSGVPDAVFVQVSDDTGAARNAQFDLAVFC